MSKDILKRLVENALEFLVRAIGELESSPKHSVIDFYSGVELFLKARLLSEHWSLVVSKKHEPDLESFLKGDFVSVSLDEAASRLEKIVRSGLTSAELETFKKVGRHRNKMVHFYHEATSPQKKEETRLSVLKEQLTAWYHLNKLLSQRWRDVFEPWQGEIDTIVNKLAGHKQYLKISFDHAKLEIELAKQNGLIISACPSCGYEAEKHRAEEKRLYQTNCLVCGLSQNAIRITCPDCDAIVTFRNEGHAQCEDCKRTFQPDDLAEELDDQGAGHLAALDGEHMELGNCSECDGYHTIVTTEDETYLCASCFSVFESLQYCGWCGDPNSGDMEFSEWSGCNHCNGRAGYERD